MAFGGLVLVPHSIFLLPRRPPKIFGDHAETVPKRARRFLVTAGDEQRINVKGTVQIMSDGLRSTLTSVQDTRTFARESMGNGISAHIKS